MPHTGIPWLRCLRMRFAMTPDCTRKGIRPPIVRIRRPHPSGCLPSRIVNAPNDKLTVRVYESLEALQALLPAWEELLSAFPAATIFSTWEWLAPWWRAFGAGRNLMVLGFFDSSEKLVGLAPLAALTERVGPGLKLRSLSLMGDGSQDSDNLDVPVRPGYEEKVARTLLDLLHSSAAAWDLCCLNTLPGDSPCGNALLRELNRWHWTCFTESRPSLVVEMPNTWEEYLRQLTSKERGKVGYLTRRLEKDYSVRYLKCTENCLEPALDALFHLHQNRWQARGEPGSFASQERQRFYRELSLGLLKRGWLEFWLLELDGKKVAAQFAFRYAKTVFTLQEGFDLAYSSQSVGYVLRARVLRQLIGEGVRRYDFLAGSGSSKTRWGTCERQYIDIHFARPWTLGAFYLRGRTWAAATKEQLRAHLPQRAWAAFHGVNLRLRGIPGRSPVQREAKTEGPT